MDQDALGQSDCRVFELTISPEHNDEKAWGKSLKLVEKSWGVCGQKWVWQLWSKDTNIGCILKRN